MSAGAPLRFSSSTHSPAVSLPDAAGLKSTSLMITTPNGKGVAVAVGVDVTVTVAVEVAEDVADAVRVAVGVLVGGIVQPPPPEEGGGVRVGVSVAVGVAEGSMGRVSRLNSSQYTVTSLPSPTA